MASVAFLRGTIGWILSDIVKDPFIANSFKRSKTSGVEEFYKIVKERDELTQRFYEEVRSHSCTNTRSDANEAIDLG